MTYLHEQLPTMGESEKRAVLIQLVRDVFIDDYHIKFFLVHAPAWNGKRAIDLIKEGRTEDVIRVLAGLWEGTGA